MSSFAKDFKTRARAFLWGMGSILDIAGPNDRIYERRRSSDAEAMGEDWKRVGRDISRSVQQAEIDAPEEASRPNSNQPSA